jgi:hypothetical protein
LQDLLVCGLE